jgi:prevent-host-death family protein
MALPKIPSTEAMNVSEARRQFSDLLNRVYRGQERIVVEKNGIPVGAIVSMADLERIRRVDADRARLLNVMDRISAGFDDLTEEQANAEVERAIAEADDARRARRTS